MNEKKKKSRLRLFSSFSVRSVVRRREGEERGGSTPVLLRVARRGEGKGEVATETEFRSLPFQPKLQRQR